MNFPGLAKFIAFSAIIKFMEEVAVMRLDYNDNGKLTSLHVTTPVMLSVIGVVTMIAKVFI